MSKCVCVISKQNAFFTTSLKTIKTKQRYWHNTIRQKKCKASSSNSISTNMSWSKTTSKNQISPPFFQGKSHHSSRLKANHFYHPWPSGCKSSTSQLIPAFSASWAAWRSRFTWRMAMGTVGLLSHEHRWFQHGVRMF